MSATTIRVIYDLMTALQRSLERKSGLLNNGQMPSHVWIPVGAANISLRQRSLKYLHLGPLPVFAGPAIVASSEQSDAPIRCCNTRMGANLALWIAGAKHMLDTTDICPQLKEMSVFIQRSVIFPSGK